MPTEILLRRATPGDRGAVRDICGEDDYIPDIFDTWVRDRRGGLWVATVRDRAVGVAKLTLLGDREAWLHGLRVHARYRRRGIARALLAHRLERATALGARVARLDTSEDNQAVRRLMRRARFRVIGRYSYWEAPARPGTAPRQATASELTALARLPSEAERLLDLRFVRRAFTRDDLAAALRKGRCLVTGPVGRPTAMAIIEPGTGPAGKGRGPARRRIRVIALAGRGPGLRALVAALPAAARRRRADVVRLVAAARHWPALRSARYERPYWRGSGMLIFEKRL